MKFENSVATKGDDFKFAVLTEVVWAIDKLESYQHKMTSFIHRLIGRSGDLNSVILCSLGKCSTT
jgi:hypothetical protein